MARIAVFLSLEAPMSLLLISNDLMTGSKVSAVAGRMGLGYSAAINIAAAVEKLTEGTSVVAIDLSMPGLKSPELVPKLRTKLKVRPRIIAFGPHVYGELLEEAETSGCDVVVSRGEFFARMMELLSLRTAAGEQGAEGEASE